MLTNKILINWNVPTNWSNFKSKLDKLDIDKILPVSVNLSQLSDVLKNDVVKKRSMQC